MAVTNKLSTPLRSAALAFLLAGATAACGDVDDPVGGVDGAPPTVSDPVADAGSGSGADADVTTADAGTQPGSDGGVTTDAGPVGGDGDGASDAGLPGDEGEPDACPS